MIVYYNKVCPEKVAMIAALLRLAQVLVVVDRWSIDLDEIFIISMDRSKVIPQKKDSTWQIKFFRLPFTYMALQSAVTNFRDIGVWIHP
jgi:hypothetical protein